MFGLGSAELIVIGLLLFVVLGIPYTLGYYTGLSKGRRESLRNNNAFKNLQ